jgi:hypothetical protein
LGNTTTIIAAKLCIGFIILTDEDILRYYPLAKTQQKKGQVA